MRFEQLFYGRGPAGYAVLGASVADGAETEAFAALCEAVGTPGVERPEDDIPFLLQKTVGDVVLMVCGRTGAPDSLGRGTLFFHALAADRQQVLARRLSALELFQRKAFAGAIPESGVSALELDVPSGRDGGEPSVRLPAVVRCERADNVNALALAGGTLYRLDWASFGWRVMPDMDFQGVYSRCVEHRYPPLVTVYDVGGKVLRDRRDATPLPAGTVPEQHASARPAEPRNVRNWMLAAAVLFALGIGIAIGLAIPNHSTSPSARPQVVERVRPLPPFDEQYRIRDFEAGIREICMPRAERGKFVRSLGVYVDYVNKLLDARKER